MSKTDGRNNTGNYNTGYCNTGYCNTGNYNTGYRNTGNYNTGYRNTGNYNTGNYNTGNYNTGYCNTGNYNTGYRNTGYCNTGDYNTGYYNTGYFCVNEGPVLIFDKPTDMSREDVQSALCDALPFAQTTVWVMSDDMTDDEKKEYPDHETTGGYLKAYESVQEATKAAWRSLSLAEQHRKTELLKALPNFDADKLLACTGIDLTSKTVEIESSPLTIVVDGVEYVKKEAPHA